MNRPTTAAVIGLKEYARNYVLLALLLVLPIAFITLAFTVTQDIDMPVRAPVAGTPTILIRPMPDVHGLIMTPITSSLIAGLAGLFLMGEEKAVDGRLVLAGYRPSELIVARFAVLGIVAFFITAVSLGVMLVDFVPERLWWFATALFVLSLIYGLLGMLIGVIFNRLAGMWVMLIVPMLDIGLFQDPLFSLTEPEWWVKLLPGYHPVQILVDVGLTTDVDTAANLGWGVGYLLILGVIAIGIFYQRTTIR